MRDPEGTIVMRNHIAAALFLMPGLASAGETDLDSRIDRVTVYPDGAVVTRLGKASLLQGASQIVLRGLGGHASRPQAGSETLVAACALVTSLQTIVSRRLDPAETAVLSVTELVTDGTRNVLPGEARIRGDVRSFNPQVSAVVERQMRVIA